MPKMTFIFEVPGDDEKAAIQHVIDAFAAQYDYRDRIRVRGENGPVEIDNPESREDHLQRRVAEYMAEVIHAADVQAAIRNAKEAVERVPVAHEVGRKVSEPAPVEEEVKR